MRCSSSPNENAWNACRDAVVTLVYGEDSFWIEAKDSPRRARIDVAALETAASTPALSGAVICSRPKTSPVAQFTALSEITYDVPSGAMVREVSLNSKALADLLRQLRRDPLVLRLSQILEVVVQFGIADKLNERRLLKLDG